MQTQEDRIKAIESRMEALSKDLVVYYNQFMELKNELKSLKTGENTVVSTQPESRPTPPLPKPQSTFQPAKTINSEEFLGGNLLSKVGIVILVIGIGIFVKYAIDNNLLNPASRIVLGYISGIGLGVLAYFTKTKYHTYSSVLVSGAMAVLYFTTYSAYHFYHFYPLWLTFGLMAVFTVLTVYLAILYDRQWIGIFGLVGAYAIPFLLSDNSGQVWKMFSYMTLINLGILWLLTRRNWYWMGGVAFLFTWMIFVFAHDTNYSKTENIYINALFSGIFFLLPIVYSFSKINKNQSIEVIELIILILGSVLYYIINVDMYGEIGLENYQSIFSFVFALFNAGLAYYLFKKTAINGSFSWFLAISALIAFYLAGYFQIEFWYELRRPDYGSPNYEIHSAFNSIWQMNYSMAFVSVLIYLMLRFKIKNDASLILILISWMLILGVLFYGDTSMLRLKFMESKLPTIGLLIRYIQYGFLAILIYFNLKLVETLSDSFKLLKNNRYLIISIILLIILSSEITTLWMFFDRSKASLQAENSTRVGYSVLWALYGLAMIVVGFYKRSKQFRIFGIVLLGVVIIKLFFYDLTNASTISKIVLFISVGVLLLIASFLYQRLSKRLLEEGD
jgi:uncharacterized membrane protein